MAEIMLNDVDEMLIDRIGRLAARCGWDMSGAIVHLLEKGLAAYEGADQVRFEGTEAQALQAALEALASVPDDPGFAMIGRAPSAG